MLSKAKKFFSNPIYLLASVASVAVLAVVAVIAFNAMAANPDGTFDEDSDYKPFNISHMYYNGTTSDVYIQTYYQELQDVSESWKVDSLNGDSVKFKKADAAEDDYNFSGDDISQGAFTLKANVPDSNAPGLDTKVWVYKWLYSNYKPYYCCVGNTTVGKLLEGKSGSYTLYSEYEFEYTRANVNFSSISLDETTADDQHGMNFGSSTTYYYAIGDTKPYEFNGSASYSLPSGLRNAYYLKNIELFYAANPDIEYKADYQKGKDIPWQKYLLKKSTAGDFAFATNLQIPLYMGYNSALDNVRADIVDASGNVLYSIKGIEGYFDYGDDYDYYAFFNFDGDAIATESFGTQASSNLNVPLAITVKYDYSRYKNPDGSNIKDPANLDGTDAVSYHSEVAYRQWGLGELGMLSVQMPDEYAPEFMPQGTDVWCATEFWRDKNNAFSRYEKGEELQLSSLTRIYELSDDDLKKLFTFNNETGFWEQVIVIEPIFERCYLTLTYNDEEYYRLGKEVYPYIYKDDAGALLEEPLAPSARLKDCKNISWTDPMGYPVSYNDFMENHKGEMLKSWNYKSDGSGDALKVGSTITMNANTDVYAQWGFITYHIVYDYHSPTGKDSDIIIKDYSGDEIPVVVPKEIIFSKDTTKDVPNGLNIFDEFANYGYYSVVDYYSVAEDTYYYTMQLDLKEDAIVPAGTAFQYWSLTNNSEYNDTCQSVYLDDFKEGADGDYYCTVHAIWSQPTYSLIYDENKQDDSDTVSNMPEPQEVTITYSELKSGYTLSDAIPTYSGKNLTFYGWSLSPEDNSSTSYICYDDFIGDDGNSTLTDGQEIRIYARWIDAKSVTYDANVATTDPIKPDGSVPVDSNKYSSSQRATVKGNTGNLTRLGYAFAGWNTASDGSGTSYVGGERILMTNNVILYAQWKPLTYKLHYNTNGKLTPVTNAPATPAEFTITGFKKNDDGKYIYTLAPDKEPAAFAYVFKGWGETPTAEVNESAGVNQSVTSIELDNFKEVTDSTGDKTYECTVYAIWNPVKYALKYNANKQTGMGDVTYVEGKEVPDDKNLDIQQFAQDTDGNYVYNQLGEVLRTEGFTFKGWSTKSDATESQSSLSIANDFNESKECLIYAVWEENTYKLDYQTGEGHDSASIPTDESKLRYTDIKGGKILSAQIPTDTGYTFAGWQINDDEDTLSASGTVAFASFNNTSKTATATATWTINNHKVTYWEDDGVTQIGEAQPYDYKADVTVGENAGTPKNFEDKTWTGEWAVFGSPSTDGNGQTIGGVGKTFKMPDNDVKFKAVYKKNTYTVRYTAGYDGSGQDDVIVDNITHGSTHNIRANSFSRTGYDFGGWRLVEPAEGYPANPAENAAITVKNNVTYKATWQIRQFTVTYKDGYSGDASKDKTFIVDYNKSHSVQPYTTFTRTGYTLTGWTLVSPTTGYSVTPNDQYNVVENVTYKAVWTANKHTVKYEITIPDDISYTKPSDEQIAFGTSVNVTSDPTGYDNKKYTFSGWSSIDVTIDDGGFTMPDKDVTIRGSFNEKGKVTLTYNANGATGGTTPDPVTDYTEVNETIRGQGNLVKTGYKFDGWNTNSNGGGTVYEVGTTHKFTQNTTIYAQWTPNEYHVRYYDINGSELTSLGETHDYGTAFTVRSNGDIPNVTGKEIIGWKIKGGKTEDADGTTISGGGTYKMPAGDVEFQAEYNDLTYTVTYQVSNAPSDYTKPETKSYKYNAAVTVAETPNITGYDFTGWSCADVDLTSGSFNMPDRNLIITGVFSEQGKVTLTYNANGGTPTSAVPASEWAYTKLTTNVKNHTGLTKKGYKFNGWNDKDDGTGKSYTIGSSYTFNANTVLYAQWQKESFTVEYYEADGTTLIASHTYAYRDSVNVGNGVAPTVGEGKEWNGKWTIINSAQKDADNVEIGTRNNYPMPAETVKYKAVLTTKTYSVKYVMEGDIPEGLSYTPPVDATYGHGETVNVASVPAGYDTNEYTFTGWDYNESGNYYAGGTSKASFAITENVVLKGVWKKIDSPDPDKATITYTSGLKDAEITDPSLNNTRTEQVVLGNDYTVHGNDGWTNYVRPGYKFVSWKVVAPKITGLRFIDNIVARFVGPANIGQTFVEGDTITGLTEDIMLQAQWEEEEYTITYNANGATNGTVPTDDKDYAYNEIATVKGEGDLSKAGAIFLNWNTQPNGNGTSYAPDAKITMNQDITLYAIWKAEPTEEIHYKLKYDANGATSGSVPQDYTNYQGGEIVSLAEKGNLDKTGCTFKEWNTKADGKGTGYKEKDAFTMPNSDVTLYAIWVDSEGNVVSPGTGELAIGINIALCALIISIITGGCVVKATFKKRKKEEAK